MKVVYLHFHEYDNGVCDWIWKQVLKSIWKMTYPDLWMIMKSNNTVNIINFIMSFAYSRVTNRIFLASRDECLGSLHVCHSPSVRVGVGVGVCAWTKTLTLAITFLQEVIGLLYCTCVFLVTRPFTWYHNFWPRDLDLEVWPTFEKL